MAEALGGTPVPWGTLTVNVVGSLLLGALVAAVSRRAPQSHLVPLIATGVLGSFTTFSAFVVETLQLPPTQAALYVAMSVGGGVVAAAAGARLVASRMDGTGP